MAAQPGARVVTLANIVRIDRDAEDRQWAEAEFAAIAEAEGSAHDHVRALFDNWRTGREVARLYREQGWATPGQAFEAKYPKVMGKRNVNQIGMTHRTRMLLSGNNVPTLSSDDVSDGALRAFGDPDEWALDQLLFVWGNAQEVARERRAAMEAKGRAPSRGVIGGDILEAMGRKRNVGTASIEYWHNVLHNLTVAHAGLTPSMAVRVASNALWAAREIVKREGGKVDPKEMAGLRDEIGRLSG